jgi:hypothetical protein
LEQFPNAAHVTLAGVRHANVLDIAGPGGERRMDDIRGALLGSTAETSPPFSEPEQADDIVFVLHGIRAGVGGWVRDVTARINRRPGWKAINPSYGYFSALEFALPLLRRRKVRWLLDRYTREIAANPRARFHFAGHSNGTYALGYGLRRVSGMQFKSVYVAGSVLPADFPWSEMRRSGQLTRLRSDRGSRDFPVGVLAKGLRGLGMHDIGSGGFSGFLELDDVSWSTEWPFVPGGHGAPLKEPRREGVVAWLIGEGSDQPPGLVDSSGAFVGLLSRFSPVVVPALVLLVVAGLVWPIWTGAWTPWNSVAFGVAALTLVGSAAA